MLYTYKNNKKSIYIPYLKYNSCQPEETELNKKELYNVPDRGFLPYAGFASNLLNSLINCIKHLYLGLFAEVRKAIRNNDPNTPLLKNVQ